MIKSKRLLALIAVASAVALAVSGCSSSGGNSETIEGTPQRGGEITMARALPVSSLMPTVPSDNGSIWAIEEVFDTLLTPSQDGKSVKPGLATSWKQSEDGLTWTFTLRKGVKFSNGQELTAKDVKFSLDQASDPEGTWGFINAAIAEVTAVDDQTVTVTTKQPYSPLPAVMAIFSNSIVPLDYGGVSAEKFEAAPVGSGPFMLDHWTKGQELKLVRNPHYWQKNKPYLDAVTFSLVADANTRANQLQGGQTQINEFPAFSSIKSLEGQQGVKVGMFASSRVDYLVFNNLKKPFTDVHVRRAVAYLIDKDAINKAVLFGHGEVAGAYMSPSSWSHDDRVKPLPYDVDRAKSELAQSSTPDGFSSTLSVNSGNTEEAAMAQIVQSAAAKIGIKLDIQTLDPSALDAARDAGNFDVMFNWATTDIIDPDEIIQLVGVLNGGTSSLWSYYDNQEITASAAKAATLNEQDERKAIYDQIQQQFDKDMPMVPLFYSPAPYSYSNTVHGFHPFATGNYGLVNVWLSK